MGYVGRWCGDVSKQPCSFSAKPQGAAGRQDKLTFSISFCLPLILTVLFPESNIWETLIFLQRNIVKVYVRFMYLHNYVFKWDEHLAVCCFLAEGIPSWMDLRFRVVAQKGEEQKGKAKLILEQKGVFAFQWFEKLGLKSRKRGK